MPTDKTRVRRHTLATALIGALLSVSIARPSLAQTAPMTSQERAAVHVVREWFAAWETKDPEKVAAYMSPNVEFRGIPTQPMRRGRAAFIQNVGRFVRLGPTVHVTEVFAIGGATGTAVLTQRIDTITLNGRTRRVPLAAFFRVDHGEIQEWLDMPLVPLGPPGGARRAAPATSAGAGSGE